MSEVSDAVQIIVVFGKAGYMVGKISVRMALMILKLLNTIYLAKWHGRVSARRMRQITGEDYIFINVGTEDKALMKAIEKEMKSHGILYARLPDLCGGDGRTQYIIPASYTAELKAFLLDHANGKHKTIKVGPISPADYVNSGMNRDGLTTEELEKLLRSVPSLEETKQLQLEDRQRFMPEIAYNVRKHDIDVEQKEKAYWIQGKPIKAHERWGMYQMPDGIHAVLIPAEDMLKGYTLEGTGKVMPPQAAVCPGKMYLMVNLKDGEQEQVAGSSVIACMKQEDIRKENERLRARNNVRTEKDIVHGPVKKPDAEKARQGFTRVTINQKLFREMQDRDAYTTRIPYKKDYVIIPKSDCRMYTLKSGTRILSAYIYHDTDYQISDVNGEIHTVKGSTLKGYYDDRTRSRNKAPTQQPRSQAPKKAQSKGVKKAHA